MLIVFTNPLFAASTPLPKQVMSLPQRTPLTSSRACTSSSSVTVKKQYPYFQVRLLTNPSTGYSWFVGEYERHVMTPVHHQYVSLHPSVPGAPSCEVWQFRLKPAAFLRPHIYTLRFKYVRPWEKLQENSRFYSLKVTTS